MDECYAAGAAIHRLLELDLKPRDIMTRRAFENAMVLVMALGGSTNAVLHLLAMARAVEVPLELADFQRTSDRVPYLADLKPLPTETGADPGPGARHKDASGEWKIVGTHPLDKVMRR